MQLTIDVDEDVEAEKDAIEARFNKRGKDVMEIEAARDGGYHVKVVCEFCCDEGVGEREDCDECDGNGYTWERVWYDGRDYSDVKKHENELL